MKRSIECGLYLGVQEGARVGVGERELSGGVARALHEAADERHHLVEGAGPQLVAAVGGAAAAAAPARLLARRLRLRSCHI